MKRTIITVDDNGMLSIQSNFEKLLMSEGEFIDSHCPATLRRDKYF